MLRQAITNPKAALPPSASDLAQHLIKDPYIFMSDVDDLLADAEEKPNKRIGTADREQLGVYSKDGKPSSLGGWTTSTGQCA